MTLSFVYGVLRGSQLFPTFLVLFFVVLVHVLKKKEKKKALFSLKKKKTKKQNVFKRVFFFFLSFSLPLSKIQISRCVGCISYFNVFVVKIFRFGGEKV